MTGNADSERIYFQLDVPELNDVYCDAAFIVPGDRGDAINQRYALAGFGVAEIVLDDGSEFHTPYVVDETPYTRALESIYEAELDGVIRGGSYDQAVDAIENGEFDVEWGRFLK